MEIMIMTKEFANEIRGKYDFNSQLNPCFLRNGIFYLPITILQDMAYAEIHEQLKSLSREEL